MSASDAKLRRFVIEGNLDSTLPLWLDAIGQGDYETAKRILEARTLLRIELTKLLAEESEQVSYGAIVG